MAGPPPAPRVEPIHILLVEDNPGDARLAQEALREGRIRNGLDIVQDGQAALAYLRQEGEHGDAPVPGLVLLDMNLPGVSGEEVLSEMKADASLSGIPVIVLTASDQHREMLSAQGLAVDGYLTKPVQAGHLLQLIGELGTYHVAIVRTA